MAILDNPKHELFAQKLAKGHTQLEAYMLAGYNTTNDDSTGAAASRLAAEQHIQDRVKDIQGEAAKVTALERADILFMLAEDRLLARDNRQAAAAITATKLLGQELLGMFIDKKEIKTGSLDDADFSELERLYKAVNSAAAEGPIPAIEPSDGGKEDPDLLPGDGPAEAGAVQDSPRLLSRWDETHTTNNV